MENKIIEYVICRQKFLYLKFCYIDTMYSIQVVCILRYPAQKTMRNVNDNEDEKCE